MLISTLSSLLVIGLIAIRTQESTRKAPALQPVRHTINVKPSHYR